jgi:hypothetical protein
VVLWLIVWAPWGTRARSRRTVYREEVPPGEVPPPRRYSADTYEDEYRR